MSARKEGGYFRILDLESTEFPGRKPKEEGGEKDEVGYRWKRRGPIKTLSQSGVTLWVKGFAGQA